MVGLNARILSFAARGYLIEALGLRRQLLDRPLERPASPGGNADRRVCGRSCRSISLMLEAITERPVPRFPKFQQARPTPRARGQERCTRTDPRPLCAAGCGAS
jgi:hypothetical protein